MTGLSAQDQRLLRRAIEVSARSVANGNMPFGAIMADPAGRILLEAENTGVTGRNTLNVHIAACFGFVFHPPLFKGFG